MRWIRGAQARINGILAERRALIYLQQEGMQLLAKNYSCKAGEIDLIMQNKGDVVFVEVKSRMHHSHGKAIEFVNRHKLSRIKKAIACYFKSKGINPATICYRIDVIGIDQGNITWIKSV